MEVSESKAVAQDAATKALLTTTWRDRPVARWVREVNIMSSRKSVVRVAVVFWIERSSSWKQVVNVILTKEENEEWQPLEANTVFPDRTTNIWDFTDDGAPILRIGN